MDDVQTLGGIILGMAVMLIGCGGGDSGSSSSTISTAPVFSSISVANDLLDGNFTTSTIVYDATADSDLNVTYTLPSSVGNNDLINIAIDGNVTFKTLPVVSNAFNDYNLTITATNATGNHTDLNVRLKIRNDVISLGSYGLLIAPVNVDGKWYYYWDRSGDGTSAGLDLTTHDMLDVLFNHDVNGNINTTILNYDGIYGTTDDYRYGELNGVKLAVPTIGSGNVNVSTAFYLTTMMPTYVDLAKIWGTYNTGYQTFGIPANWPKVEYYWSATVSTNGHAQLIPNGLVGGRDDSANSYVAFQVL